MHPVLAKAKMKKKQLLQTERGDEEMEVGKCVTSHVMPCDCHVTRNVRVILVMRAVHHQMKRGRESCGGRLLG